MKVRVAANPNIAFIKYWGKEKPSEAGRLNWALNPSLSMTLAKATTFTNLEFVNTGEDSFLIDGAMAKEADQIKVRTHIHRICEALDYPSPQGIRYESENNFPKAAGIASSASAFAALTWATLGCLKGVPAAESWIAENLRRASEMCRWGSGSACRSVAGPFMLWENEAASVREFPMRLRDTVILVSRSEKKVSSRDGHEAARSSPLLTERLKKLPARTQAMISALERSNFRDFGELLEAEALEMHEVARQGIPSVEYWTQDTRRILNAMSEMTDRDFYFTLDAGPNIHVISERDVTQDLARMLSSLGIRAELWEDESGSGPRYLEI